MSMSNSSITLYPTNVVMTNGQTKSLAVGLRGLSMGWFVLPAGFDGTTLTFEVSQDGTNFFPLYDQLGNVISVPVAASRGYFIDPGIFAGFSAMKFVSGTAQSGGDTVIGAGVRAV